MTPRESGLKQEIEKIDGVEIMSKGKVIGTLYGACNKENVLTALDKTKAEINHILDFEWDGDKVKEKILKALDSEEKG